MASIIVKDLNYITTGKNEKFVSLDIGYSADEFGISDLSLEENVYDPNFTSIGENKYAAKYFKNYAYIPDVVYAASLEENLDEYADNVDNKNNIYSIF